MNLIIPEDSENISIQIVSDTDTDEIYLSNNNNNLDDETKNIQPISNTIELNKNDINEINNRNNELDNIYNEDELEDIDDDNNSSFSDPLQLATFEQIKSYLTNTKSYFNDSLIQSVAQIILSNNNNESNNIQNIVSDIIISFSQICKNIKEIEYNFGEIINKSTFNNIVIDTCDKISTKMMSDNIPFSIYLSKSTFEETTRNAKYVADLATDKELNRYIETLLLGNSNISYEQVVSIKKSIDSKMYMIDIVKCVQEYTSFITKDANKCSTLQEFLLRFKKIIDDSSTYVSNIDKNESTSLTNKDILGKKFHDTIINNENKHIKTGIPVFDAISNGGFEKGRTTIFSGKTGGGKSTVLINIFYSMYKTMNGMFLPELTILQKLIENDYNIETFKQYCAASLESLKNEDIELYGESKKHIIIYFTFENGKEETAKRIMCREGLLTSSFWKLIESDPYLSNMMKEKGFLFRYDDLPKTMEEPLKRRLFAISQFMKIIDDNDRCEYKIIWYPPDTITAYELKEDIKKEKRKGNIVDAIFVDYPDKMKPISLNKGDQSWDALGKVYDNLKSLANQEDTTIVTISQLTREGNKNSGNKANIIKAGNTAGSQQKENNADTLINMNFHSDDDNDTSKTDMFKVYQKNINASRMSIANQIFNPNKDIKTDMIQLKNFTDQSSRATEILQLAFALPKLQTISNYIVKNRDNSSDISFETYIVYGLYMVTDYIEEAISSAKFAVETYIMMAKYLFNNKLIDMNMMQICNNKINEFEKQIQLFRNQVDLLNNNLSGANNNQTSYKDFSKFNNNYNNNQQQNNFRPQIPSGK